MKSKILGIVLVSTLNLNQIMDIKNLYVEIILVW